MLTRGTKIGKTYFIILKETPTFICQKYKNITLFLVFQFPKTSGITIGYGSFLLKILFYGKNFDKRKRFVFIWIIIWQVVNEMGKFIGVIHFSILLFQKNNVRIEKCRFLIFV